ncbi:SMI1/KNR4 family protein [Mucilaginibacter gotjawali]|uniref:Uncharacterized protein n=2 Tax=Mucilaginibacter gotjawali TaxID=1550579 RepID=A0A110B0I7_9SPHI|nr:SMI1/KNR4 family protein [Mucilaginibacter gotjawali]MBB3059189.1 cell wall assembly regulator SMI1 [Mucilaginibacter gotjawali]BAU52400.1 hypothetical protein MgSA37_00557 [Mucilaginibacter gotjawali]
MFITEAIELLKTYNGPLGLTLHKGASGELINKAENTYGVTFPTDFKTFYRFTDGFETGEDIFHKIPPSLWVCSAGQKRWGTSNPLPGIRHINQATIK